jgi:hypothetical protein
MTYSTINAMRQSMSLLNRITACAAQEGVVNPDQWARDQIWSLTTDDEMEARWDDAEFNYNATFNPDTGARPDVITDSIITRVVKARVAALGTP